MFNREVTIVEHQLRVPWERGNPALGDIELYAREFIAPGAENLPHLLYLQGGPGFPVPLPTTIDGWLGTALKHYRVILLDQRGTGRSGRIDLGCGLDLTLEHLLALRAGHIVEDCEDLRRHLGVSRWALLGQSFGGFCISSYLSRYPDSISHAFITGGLPATAVHADVVYQATYTKLAARQRKFFAAVPWAQERIKEICHHLDNTAELLPSGERLSSRRFRTIGLELGRDQGFPALAGLLESPFYPWRGEKRLRGDVLAEIGERVSFARGPLYALIHEAIYGGNVDGATAFSAHRQRDMIPGFAEELDPRAEGEFFLTGEHIYPWQFEEDPALRGFEQLAHTLAAYPWDSSRDNLYDLQALRECSVPVAAAVYTEDIFVPRELSLETAAHFGNISVWESAKYQHNGIRGHGEEILGHLLTLV